MSLEKNGFEKIEKKIKYKFKNSSLLEQALTHSSYSYENKMGRKSSNQKLEFLGDALLGFIVAKIVFEIFSEEKEGVVSKIKNYWVSAKVLSEITKEIGLHKALLLGRGEEKSGGRDNSNNLADTFEALIAAVYLDGGIRKAEALVTRLFKKRILEMGKEVILFDFKTRLQEIYQKKYKDKPQYITEYEKDHFVSKAMFRGRVIGKGYGSRKKSAEQEAAKSAFKKRDKGKRGL